MRLTIAILLHEGKCVDNVTKVLSSLAVWTVATRDQLRDAWVSRSDVVCGNTHHANVVAVEESLVQLSLLPALWCGLARLLALDSLEQPRTGLHIQFCDILQHHVYKTSE